MRGNTTRSGADASRTTRLRDESRGDGSGGKPGGPVDGDAAGQRGAEVDAAMGAAEHLTRDLERVRSKFGVDPALGRRSLASAWMSETSQEEYEAEFVDTVADCLGAGLSLDDALTCWETGDLATDAVEDAVAGESDEDVRVAGLASRVVRPPSGHHRVFVR